MPSLVSNHNRQAKMHGSPIPVCPKLLALIQSTLRHSPYLTYLYDVRTDDTQPAEIHCEVTDSARRELTNQ